MTTAILIVAYLKDKPWLEWNLKSIRKFATGFSSVVLVVPETEKEHFSDVKDEYKCAVYGHALPGHLGAQAQKCCADIYTEADFVLHTDADCIFTQPVTPEDYIKEGKPVMLIERFSRLNGNPWKPTVDKALGGDNQFETMRRHPQVNPLGIYSDMRHHIENRHRQAFQDYVTTQKPEFPWGFSEHCTIGAFALNTHWRSAYHWIDLGMTERPPDKLMQFWSHSPPEIAQGLPSGGVGVPMEEFQKLGL